MHGIGPPIGFRVEIGRIKPMPDSGAWPAFLPQNFIQVFLAEEFVKPVLRIVVADEQDFFDLIRHRRQPVCRARIDFDGSLRRMARAMKKGRIGSQTGLFLPIQPVERDECRRQFDGRCGVEIAARIAVPGPCSEVRQAVFVAVNLRKNDLRLIHVHSGNDSFKFRILPQNLIKLRV